VTIGPVGEKSAWQNAGKRTDLVDRERHGRCHHRNTVNLTQGWNGEMHDAGIRTSAGSPDFNDEALVYGASYWVRLVETLLPAAERRRSIVEGQDQQTDQMRGRQQDHP
jgi:hypothetical protein